MKSNAKVIFIGLFLSILTKTIFGDNRAKAELKEMYDHHCMSGSDINEHIPVLKNLAIQCSSVVEIGVRSMVATWGILYGLSENDSPISSYLGVDLEYPPLHVLKKAESLAIPNNIDFKFWQKNDMDINIEDFPQVDLLFIDSLHTYCHLTYELEKFAPKTKKYIAMHDTSHPYGTIDDYFYKGDFSEYPDWFDKNKRGLWAAVEDFLARHPEWRLKERRFNNHGFTVLERN
jgi:hypothetical protein